MPEFRQYPEALSLRPTDAFLIERVNSGTMYIEASNMNFASYGGYDIAMGFQGTLPTSTALFVFNSVRPFSLPIGLVGTEVSFQHNPSSTVTFQILKNLTTIGTISVNSSGGVTISFAAEISFVAGDELKVDTPSDLYGATSLSITFKGLRA